VQKSEIWGSKEEVGLMHDAKETVQKISGAVQGVFGSNEGVQSLSADVIF
jgi:hypothetical protein